MSTVIHVRIPRKMKEELERYGLNISIEVRRLLELRLRALRLKELLQEIEKEEIPVKHDSTKLIREDRDRTWRS